MKPTNELKRIARETLQTMAKRNGGKITPAAVVEAARAKNSPLHRYFEWDNTKAAQLYREDQARALIRSVKVQITTETKRVVAVGYVRDPLCESTDQGYVSVQSILSDEDAKREVLIAEFERAAAAIKRAKALAHVFDMADDIDSFLAELQVLTARVVEYRPDKFSGTERPEA